MRDGDPRSYSSRVLTIAGISIVLIGAWLAIGILLLVFAGVLLAILLRALTNWVTKHTPMPDSWALGAVVVTLVLLFAGANWLLAPRLAAQADQISQQLPESIQRIRENLEQSELGRHVVSQVTAAAQSLGKSGSWLGRASGLFSSILGVAGGIVAILFIGLYLASAPSLYVGGLVRLIPIQNRSRARQVLGSIHNDLQHWLAGKLSLMALVGVLTAIGLWALGMPLVFSLALLAALLDFIPNIGPLISAIPAVLLALLQSPMQALYVALLYLGVQTLESYILSPIVQQKAVSLPPALLISSQLLIGVLLGSLGLVLATPLTVMLMVIVRMVYVEDTLGDQLEHGKP